MSTIHRFTSAHRQAGGLRRVSFALWRMMELSHRLGRKPRVVVMGWQQGSVALPLMDLGCEVTLIEQNADVRADAAQVAKECGFTKFSAMSEVSLDREGATFDVALVDLNVWNDTQAALAVIRPHLEANARIVVSGASQEGMKAWDAFQSGLFTAGWRMREATSTVALHSTLTRRVSQSNVFQRTLESVLLHLLPLRHATAWIAELVPCDPERPYVLHLMPSLGVGGTETLVLDLAFGLRAKGFETAVIATICGGALEPIFHERGIDARVIERTDPLGISTLIDLVRVFRLERPAVVHTNLFGADAWGRFAAFIAGVPVVITTEHNVNPHYSRIKRFVNRVFARWTDAVIAVSESVREMSVTQDRIPAEKVYVITNAIDTSRVIPRGGRTFHDVPRLFIAARLYPQKDHATLFKALALVKRPWRLRIAGDGPLKSDLMSLAERLDISSRIEWLGIRHDVPQLLAESDVFCFPSRWEGLGNAVLEAAAAGLPVVCSDLAPLREVFRDDDVLFVAPGNVPAWSRALQAVLEDPSSAVIRATRLAPRVIAESSLDRMVEAYAELFRTCMKRV